MSKSVSVCCRQEIGARAIEMHGTLEKQLEDLKAYQESIISDTPEINALESIHQEIQGALIFDNPYTSYTMEVTVTGTITSFPLLKICICYLRTLQLPWVPVFAAPSCGLGAAADHHR